MGKLSLIFLMAWNCFGAFRAYELKVTSFDSKGKRGKTRTVVTTLDPLQYEHYYAGYRWEEVRLVDHWYCPGDTSRKKICKKPKPKKPEPWRGISSYDKPKRIEMPLNRQPVIP